jgi:hypothetical protein
VSKKVRSIKIKNKRQKHKTLIKKGQSVYKSKNTVLKPTFCKAFTVMFFQLTWNKLLKDKSESSDMGKGHYYEFHNVENQKEH